MSDKQLPWIHQHGGVEHTHMCVFEDGHLHPEPAAPAGSMERARLQRERDDLAAALREHVDEHQRNAMYPKHAPRCNCYDLCAWAKPLLARLEPAPAEGE